jgi:hypothetical protein
MPFKCPKSLILIMAVTFVGALFGCQSVNLGPAKDSITFIDTQKFDNDLSVSLVSIKNPVEVDFHNPITPNEIPPRLEKWLSMVDKSGGKVNIASPVGEPKPKSPALILGLFSGLWNAFKILSAENSAQSMENAVKSRDANIQLARNAQGNLYIQKITFNERTMK